MIRSFMHFRHIALLAIVSVSLSGCLGGTIAQQIVRSIGTHIADKAVARALDVEEGVKSTSSKPNNTAAPYQNSNAPYQNGNAPYQNSYASHQNSYASQSSSYTLPKLPSYQLPAKTEAQNTPPDPYRIAFANASFEPVAAIVEPLPKEAVEIEVPVAVVQSNLLVAVECYNLLIGDEKAAIYAKAQLMGSNSLPKLRDWQFWQVATGEMKTESSGKKLITFLVPPEFGKLSSGSIALVEIARPGELNIARYKVN